MGVSGIQRQRASGPASPTRSIRSLADLRLALIAGERVRDGIATGVPCTIVPTDPDEADMLLVDSSGLDRDRRGLIPEQRVAEAARRFREAGLGTAIWLTSTRDAASATESLLGGFDRVFSIHPYAADLAADPSPVRPAVLLPAATPRALAADVSEKAGVAYLGGYSARWSPRSRTLIDGYLRASLDSGLTIVAVRGSEPEGLPARLEACMQQVDTAAEAIDLLAGSRALIAPAPVEEQESVPEAVMDALAARVRVIMPPNAAARLAFPGTVIDFAGLGEQFIAALANWTRAGKHYDEPVDQGREVIHNTHTYRHRLAAIVSALGHPLLP